MAGWRLDGDWLAGWRRAVGRLTRWVEQMQRAKPGCNREPKDGGFGPPLPASSLPACPGARPPAPHTSGGLTRGVA